MDSLLRLLSWDAALQAKFKATVTQHEEAMKRRLQDHVAILQLFCIPDLAYFFILKLSFFNHQRFSVISTSFCNVQAASWSGVRKRKEAHERTTQTRTFGVAESFPGSPVDSAREELSSCLKSKPRRDARMRLRVLGCIRSAPFAAGKSIADRSQH